MAGHYYVHHGIYTLKSSAKGVHAKSKNTVNMLNPNRSLGRFSTSKRPHRTKQQVFSRNGPWRLIAKECW